MWTLFLLMIFIVIPDIAIVYLFFSLPMFVPPYELHWLLVYKMEIRTKMWIMYNFCGCSIRTSFLVIQMYISSMKVLYTLLNVSHNLLFLPKVRVMTNVVQVYRLLGYTHQIQVGYIIFTKYPYFSISIYFNQMDTQRYIILKKYTHFITLNIYIFKSSYPSPCMFSNLGKSY
jgi:hypothetical protein